MTLDILAGLVNRIGIIIILSFVSSKVNLLKKLALEKEITFKDKTLMAVFFGIMGIIGTYTGIPVKSALANSRVIGVFVGGLLGGPYVGVLSGVIAGGHRFFIGGFTALSCAISTIISGFMSGFLSKRFYNRDNKWTYTLFLGAISEAIQMCIIIALARPIADSIELVKLIALPMIITNSIGISICIGISESIFKDQQRAASIQAQRALNIANKTLKYFRKGFNEETSYKTAEIIYNMTSVKAVSITNTEKILSHIGIGEDHHKVGDYIKTGLTKEVINQGVYKVANYHYEINCNHMNCKLKSAVIVPLKEKNKTIGCLKLYKTTENSITQVDLELALGLASLFSTQIELSKLEYQSKLLAKSELKALQAQINPHFLFNAINTIVSLIRTKPEKARKLLLNLGDYFRKNLYKSSEEVDLLEEIKHVKSYISIEKARFGDKLSINFHIDKNINCSLPPLILQPIVENSIKHGILKKLDGGNVDIYVIDNKDNVKLIVKDNGVGMSEETINNILYKENTNGSIGLINVNNRLKTKYDDDYGLIIESTLNKGTTVTMKIPKI
ncbi:LytS/YhcK type 5TM receptor domain-containing protein [Dethiothermospora halolimnae]|uniref:LytS/YhcK type 5TM receptor domain-containing protein n=1 Tax=Dethiothermospora halolimnae TaxID=3114390 RepID=UPI003CCB7CA4